MMDESKMLRLDKYIVGETIGSGIFKVKILYDPSSHKKYAAKICKESYKRESLLKEAAILSKLTEAKIQNIVQMVELLDTKPSRKAPLFPTTEHQTLDPYKYSAAIVMELAPNQTLFEHVSKHKGFNEKLARSYFRDLIITVQSLHKKGFVHRDIKLENILIDENYNLKLADFGFARAFDETSQHKMRTRLGTEYYMAPEMRQEDHYSGTKVDVFACGVILFLLVIGRPPFARAFSADPLYQYFCDEKACVFWEKVEQKFGKEKELKAGYKELVSSLLARDPERRPSIEQILESEWMQRDYYTEEERKELMCPSGKMEVLSV